MLILVIMISSLCLNNHYWSKMWMHQNLIFFDFDLPSVSWQIRYGQLEQPFLSSWFVIIIRAYFSYEFWEVHFYSLFAQPYIIQCVLLLNGFICFYLDMYWSVLVDEGCAKVLGMNRYNSELILEHSLFSIWANLTKK